jgi:hypothetical protein
LADLKKYSPLKPQLISKGDNGKNYLSFNSLGNIYLSFNRGEDFLEINQSETRIACYGRSSLKSAHFVMVHYQTWPPQAILVSDWLIFKNLLINMLHYISIS